jgi:8-oxo-dGTP diphosphatase
MSDKNNDIIKKGVGVWLFNPKGQLLLGLRLSKHGFNTWAPPGGKPEPNETLIDTAIRETAEETGMQIKPEMLKFLCVTDDVFEDSHFMTTHYCAKNINMTPYVLEKNKCEKWQWFDMDKLPGNLFLSAQNLLKQKVFGV